MPDQTKIPPPPKIYLDGPSKPPRPPPFVTPTPPTIVSLHLTTVPVPPQPTRRRKQPTLLFGKTTTASLKIETSAASDTTTKSTQDQTNVAPSEQSYTTSHVVQPGSSFSSLVTISDINTAPQSAQSTQGNVRCIVSSFVLYLNKRTTLHNLSQFYHLWP